MMNTKSEEEIIEYDTDQAKEYEDTLKKAFIKELVRARKEKGLSQREVALRCNIKQPVLARMESGKSSPNLTTVFKVLGVLGKTIHISEIEKPRNEGNHENIETPNWSF